MYFYCVLVHPYLYEQLIFAANCVKATGWWFSSGPPVSSTNKTNHHDITEILMKVVLNTINLTPV
jgi:hypothetical protein